ncbi:hypothetical protein GD416_34755 [Burkholderia sp. BE24]|nr:hypothetical protein [Burkholderia sp. BE24]
MAAGAAPAAPAPAISAVDAPAISRSRWASATRVSFMFEIDVGPQRPNGRRRRFYDASRGPAIRNGGRPRVAPAMPRGIAGQALSNRRDITMPDVSCGSEGCHAPVD